MSLFDVFASVTERTIDTGRNFILLAMIIGFLGTAISLPYPTLNTVQIR
jgi:hypothetical protein